MSVVTVSGIIDDGNGNKIQNFNGELTIVVLIKFQRITTLNNHGDGAMTYSDRPNTLFSGRALVKMESFLLLFMLPKDIKKYNYGTGRINYYAYDKTNEKEAQGYYENPRIGGTNEDVVADTTGPEMKLYMNPKNFRSGGKVNETPFIAHLSDVNGINRVEVVSVMTFC